LLLALSDRRHFLHPTTKIPNPTYTMLFSDQPPPQSPPPVNGAVCGRLYQIYTDLPRDVRGVVTIDTFVTFFNIRQVRSVFSQNTGR
jgi:hypothetical protein